jgi:TolB-like protein/DNA-binding winged helix-turn-helix (wHTH) protein/Tfp pilus assembly protein PilF
MESSRASKKVVRFGTWEVDFYAEEIRKAGVKVRLQQHPFQVLALLLESPGAVVTREKLRQTIWPNGTFVDFDEGLDTVIYKLRHALGDSADNPRYIETLPRRGYRFIATVDELVLSDTGHPDVSFVTGDRGAGVSRTPAEINTRPVTPSDGASKPNKTPGIYAIAIGTVVVAGFLTLLFGLDVGGVKRRFSGTAPAGTIRSIAVLPLENLSGDPSQEYFTDGISEILISDLGKIKGLRVTSRLSTMHYKDTRKTLPEIARELNVDSVVEGSVLQSRGRVKITIRLVEASRDRLLWADTYQRDLGDALALQDEIARDIAAQVKIKLSLQEQVLFTKAPPVDAETQDAYLRGRYESNKWTEEGLTKSVDYFEQALGKNRNYAQAWAGLSYAYHLIGLFGFSPAQVAFPKAKVAALKALEIDESLSEAHVSLAAVLASQEWLWPAVEKELHRALALNPSNAVAHQYYGYYLSPMGRLDEAITEMKRARELDPLSPTMQHSLAATLYRAGRYDEALESFMQVPDGDANSEKRHRWMASIYERKGMYREAAAELVTALRLSNKHELAAQIARRYVSSGYAETKRAFLWGDLREEQRRAKIANLTPHAFEIATDYALLGEKNKAFEWLDKAFQKREVGLVDLTVDENFQSLRTDPRFQDLVKRLGLPL